jgi:hypothetical protein
VSEYLLPSVKEMSIFGPKATRAQLLEIGEGRKPELKPEQILVSPKQRAAWEALAAPVARHSCLYGGTRSGKTFLIVRAILKRAAMAAGTRHAMLRFRGNAARHSLALDTLPNVVRICFPGLKLEEARQDGYFQLPNGSQIWIGGLDDKERVEKILGTEFSTIFLNEASQIPFASFLVAMTRLAQVHDAIPQRAYVDLNPVGKSHWTNQLFVQKVDPVSKKKLRDPHEYVYANLNPVDNAHNLSKKFLDSLAYQPDKQRKRFFEGVFVDEVEGALWTYESIAKNRVEPSEIPISDRQRVVVAVDPSGARNEEDTSKDEIGIVVMAKNMIGHAFVLEDGSLRAGPQQWATRAVALYHQYSADAIIAEANFGGEMVRSTIQAVDPNVPVRLVSATRGKIVRAEPISVHAAAGRIHHVGDFPILEDQLCAFSEGGYKGAGSPDHADAYVWAATDLLGTADTSGMVEFYRRLAAEQEDRNNGVHTVERYLN